MLCIQKSQTRPGMGYCCYIWVAAAQLPPSTLDRLRKRSCSCVRDEIFSTRQSVSNRLNVISLSLVFIYYYSRCSNEFHSLVLISQGRKPFLSCSFDRLRLVTSWKKYRRECFHVFMLTTISVSLSSG